MSFYKLDRSSGFTLMEVLVSFLILALLMSAAYASFSLISSGSFVLGLKAPRLKGAERSFLRLTRDFNSLYLSLPPSYTKPDLFDGQNDGKRDPFYFKANEEFKKNRSFSFVSFASDAHLSFYSSEIRGIARITYLVKEKADGSFALFRSDYLHPYPDSEEDKAAFLLCDSIVNFKLKFMDWKEEWRDSWDSESSEYAYSTPLAVSIHMEIGDKLYEKGAKNNNFIFDTTVLFPVTRPAQGEF